MGRGARSDEPANESTENEYEAERNRIIAENQKRLQELGVLEITSKLHRTVEAGNKRVTSRRPLQARVVVPVERRERSRRLAEMPPVNYLEAAGPLYERVTLERRPRKTVNRRQLVHFPHQSEYAMKQASDAATAKVEELDGRGYFKPLMPSQVSGGFWLQVPNDYHAKYKYSHPTKIILECECTRHEQSFIYRSRPKEWEVIYLPRPNNSGAGLSGGWRGYAIDKSLTPSDCIVFEVPEDLPSGQLPSKLKCHIYRAEDYETAETLAELAVWNAKHPPPAASEEEEEEEAVAPEAEGEAAAAQEKAPKQKKGKRKAAAGKADDGSDNKPKERKVRQKKGAAAQHCFLPLIWHIRATRPSRTAKTAAAAKIAGLDKEEAAVKDAAGTEVEAAAGKKEAAGSRKEAAGTKKGKGNAEPHGPWAVDEDKTEHYVVEKVVRARKLKTARPEFLIRWWSYAAEDDSWEPIENLDDGDPFALNWEDNARKTAAEALARQHKWHPELTAAEDAAAV